MLQATVLSHHRFAPAATAFTSEIAVAFGCVRVTLGLVHRGAARLQAVSHGGDAKLVGEAFDGVRLAMDEAIDQGVSIALPQTTPRRGIHLAHSRLLRQQGGAVLTVPLPSFGEIVGALTCEWVAPPTALDHHTAELEEVLSFVGPVLHLMHRAEAPWHERAAARARNLWKALRAPHNSRLRWGLGAGACALAVTLLVPVDHRVGGRARIEGERQRALVAPVAGFLERAHVRPGDRVEKGQVLIELADKDLKLQRRRSESELALQENAYATALARADRATLVVALSKADEARSQIGLIDAELERSRIVAPFDGVVIQGDLSQSLGAPVERGQPLMLVAPDGKFRVVMEVDERDIAAVRVGQSGSLSLSALPWQALEITVSRIDPMARIAEGSNVFQVEAQISADASSGTSGVRPGLEGVAGIAVGNQPVAWTALQRLVRWARVASWSWLP